MQQIKLCHTVKFSKLWAPNGWKRSQSVSTKSLNARLEKLHTRNLNILYYMLKSGKVLLQTNTLCSAYSRYFFLNLQHDSKPK